MAEPWLVALLAIGAMAMWLRRGQMTRTARAVLVVVLAFFCVKGVLYAQMLRVAHVSVDGVQEQTAGVEARWGTLTQWTVFERDSGMLRSEIVDGWRGTRTPAIAWPIVPASPLVATSRSLDTVNNFLQRARPSARDRTPGRERRHARNQLVRPALLRAARTVGHD